jgi:glycosyltransferase involved in cell wall biosynthesis
MIEEAAHLGIGHKVLFTGFLRGRDVDRVFRMADVYVMPSVSEPFGIAPLEAMRNDVPVIISKQSGVSEVLTHALKVDFWDIDEMANKIVAVLRHPPLGQTLREHGAFELRRLTWDGAAAKCVQVYGRALSTVGAV